MDNSDCMTCCLIGCCLTIIQALLTTHYNIPLPYIFKAPQYISPSPNLWPGVYKLATRAPPKRAPAKIAPWVGKAAAPPVVEADVAAPAPEVEADEILLLAELATEECAELKEEASDEIREDADVPVAVAATDEREDSAEEMEL